MPIFFFHVRGGDGQSEDPQGVELPDEEAAFYQAYRRARDLADGDRALIGIEPRLVVENEERHRIWSIPVNELVSVGA